MIRKKLLLNQIKVLYRIAPLTAGHIQHMGYNTCTFDMTQKIVPQACSGMSAFNETGDIRHDKGSPFPHVHNAQIWFNGGEVIIGNFRFRPGQNRKYRAFSYVRKTDQTDIRNQFYF